MKEKVKLLKALGDEVRIEIVRNLLDGEKCACSFVPLAGKSQPNVSRHLKILVEAGVLEPRRKGVYIWYKLKSKDAAGVMQALGIGKTKTKARGC